MDRILRDAQDVLIQQSLEVSRWKAYMYHLQAVLKHVDNPALLDHLAAQWRINTQDEPSLDLAWKDEHHDCTVSIFHDGYVCDWWIGIRGEKRFADGCGGEDEKTGIDYSSLGYFIEFVEDGDAALQDYLRSHKTN